LLGDERRRAVTCRSTLQQQSPMQRSVFLRFAALLIVASSSAEAQAWSYPSFQPPRVTTREFNFGLADAGHSGTVFVFQWREQAGPKSQLSFDLGVADRDCRDCGAELLLGGQYAYQLARSTADVPFDFLFTAGAFAALGDVNLFRIPFGLSMGHRFPLDGNVAITPYVHPRISIDFCGDCVDETNIGVNFDLGGNFELTRTIALRISALFGGSKPYSGDGFGISFAWTPPGLSR
jgi:hypothetical protein